MWHLMCVYKCCIVLSIAGKDKAVDACTYMCIATCIYYIINILCIHYVHVYIRHCVGVYECGLQLEVGLTGWGCLQDSNSG